MPFLVALLVIALIIAFLFLSTLFIVPQQQAYICLLYTSPSPRDS